MAYLQDVFEGVVITTFVVTVTLWLVIIASVLQ